MTMNEEEWRNNLKSGDEVIVATRNGSGIRKVARVTNTQVIVLSGLTETRYNKRTGFATALGKWDTDRIEYPDPIRVAAIREGAKRRRLLELTLGGVPKASTAALEQIAAILMADAAAQKDATKPNV